MTVLHRIGPFTLISLVAIGRGRMDDSTETDAIEGQLLAGSRPLLPRWHPVMIGRQRSTQCGRSPCHINPLHRCPDLRNSYTLIVSDSALNAAKRPAMRRQPPDPWGELADCSQLEGEGYWGAAPLREAE